MKRTSHAVLGLAAIAALAGPPQLAIAAQDAEEAGEAQEAVDDRVLLLEARLEVLELELAATRSLLDETVSYLQAQAQAARSLGSSLDAAEAAGFTAGINYRSRELLLNGWRQALQASQTRLPGSQAGAEPRD